MTGPLALFLGEAIQLLLLEAGRSTFVIILRVVRIKPFWTAVHSEAPLLFLTFPSCVQLTHSTKAQVIRLRRLRPNDLREFKELRP